MKSSVALVIAIIAIILVGWFLINGRNNTATSPTATTPTNQTTTDTTENPTTTTEDSTATQDTTVTYGANGFSPATLTVKKGTTVTFKNTSSRAMWVASDPHPQHNRMPAFDAEKGIPSGESYTFTFNEAGSWGYHNHLNAGDKGTIVVQ